MRELLRVTLWMCLLNLLWSCERTYEWSCDCMSECMSELWEISWRYGGDHEDSRRVMFFYSDDGEAAYPPETPVTFNRTTIISASLFIRKRMRRWKMNRWSKKYMN